MPGRVRKHLNHYHWSTILDQQYLIEVTLRCSVLLVETFLFRINLAVLSPTTPCVGRRLPGRFPAYASWHSSIRLFHKFLQPFVWTRCDQMRQGQTRNLMPPQTEYSFACARPLLCNASPQTQQARRMSFFNKFWWYVVCITVKRGNIRIHQMYSKESRKLDMKAFGGTSRFHCDVAPETCKLLQCAAESHASRPSRAHIYCLFPQDYKSCWIVIIL